MKTIHKYQCDKQGFHHSIPIGAEFVYVGADPIYTDRTCVWAKVNTNNKVMGIILIYTWTGEANPDGGEYIGSHPVGGEMRHAWSILK